MKSFRKFLMACVLAFAAITLAGCGNKTPYTLSAEDQSDLGMQAQTLFNSIIAMDNETIDQYIDDYEYSQEIVWVNGLNSWKSGKAELGEFKSVKTVDVTRKPTDGTYKVVLMTEFANRDCEFILGLDRKMAVVKELTFNPVYTLGEKLSQAGVNLLVGMGTVFAVLIFLTWVISLFKYVNKAQEKLEQKKSSAVMTETAAKKPAAAAPAAKAAPAAPDNSNEIQAVIAAAIAAYEAECGSFVKQPALNNGRVIRSFKRR